MNDKKLAAAMAAAAGLLALPHFAHAHAVAGARVFPGTMEIDDPGVGDELVLPQVQYQRGGANGGPGPTHEVDFGFEYDKTITERLAIGFNYGWDVLQQHGAKTQTGFENFGVSLKYEFYVNPEHEFMTSVAVERDFGRTGTTHLNGDTYGSTQLNGYFGKGLGDMPIGLLRPLAITGQLGYSIADKKLKGISATDPDSGLVSLQYNAGNPNQWSGGFTVQYSLPYLQSQVKDFGFSPFVNRLVPIVEFAWTSPASSPSNQGTTWTAAPGVIYEADTYQVAVEALIPLNKAAGTNVGGVVQLHMFFDDMFPNTLGKPIFQ
jgi:hypothetical protein